MNPRQLRVTVSIQRSVCFASDGSRYAFDELVAGIQMALSQSDTREGFKHGVVALSFGRQHAQCVFEMTHCTFVFANCVKQVAQVAERRTVHPGGAGSRRERCCRFTSFTSSLKVRSEQGQGKE